MRNASRPSVVVQFGLEKPGFFKKPGFLVAKLYHYPTIYVLAFLAQIVYY
jgi:hypothetical protein